ncbi:phytase [Microbulbifer halophilus]|uniref:Phytase n=1 Tax=Microbulbifer halophilus TaxID=453963 RepID=A0ABW5EAT1_9GAMM|nr:phytase [Microbulbifer halophilus]MCW8126477.1 phytase [Microbulbifer halophilus]
MDIKPLQTLIPAAIALGLLAGCGAKTETAGERADTRAATLEAAQTLPLANVVANQLAPLTLDGKSYLLLASEERGLVLVDGDGNEAASLNGGEVERFAVQSREDGSWLVSAYEDGSGEIQLFSLAAEGERPQFSRLGAQAASAPMEALCLSRQGGRPHLFAIDEEGLGSEYVVHPRGERWVFKAVRPLYFGQEVTSCAVDDVRGRLLVTQPPLGVLSLNADAEADEQRRIFAAAPEGEFGGLWVDAEAGHLWLSAEDGVRAYDLAAGGEAAAPVFAAAAQSPEPVSAVVSGGDLLAVADEADAVQRFEPELPAPSARMQALRRRGEMSRVTARGQTQPVASPGDAADDPAIWVNPADATASLVFGTDKQGFLNVYDLSGDLLQAFPEGRINNVDVRSVEHPRFAAVAAASNRTTPGINLFGITATGKVESLGLRPLQLEDPYGLCMSSRNGELFAWVSDKAGSVLQQEIRLTDDPLQWQMEERARVRVDTQVEGCVSDDARASFFFAEEDRGVWRLDLAAFDAGEGRPRLVMEVDGERLVDDLEGMALYADGDSGYLVVSSQGNNSYALLSRDGSEFVGNFRLDMDPARGMDGASETDGLEVTSAPLGADYPQGLLVVQDGRKRMPAGNQNFKLVSWADIADELQL